MYTSDRNAYRQTFFVAWQKHQKRLPLEQLEAQIVAVILQHPEYQLLLDQPKAYAQQSFVIEENPFYHLSLHLALQDQIQQNRPAGIKEIYQTLILLHQNQHHVQHLMIFCLASILQTAHNKGVPPDEERYLQELRALLS